MEETLNPTQAPALRYVTLTLSLEQLRWKSVFLGEGNVGSAGNRFIGRQAFTGLGLLLWF
ncbi:hypothetical protein OROHE_013778 [Orobanche hederae]